MFYTDISARVQDVLDVLCKISELFTFFVIINNNSVLKLKISSRNLREMPSKDFHTATG